MKTCKAITIFSVLFLLAFLAGQAQAAKEGHNWDANVLALTGGTTVDCVKCHLQSHSDADGGGFVPHGDVVYDRCFQCHNASGVASSATIVSNHKSDGAVDCGFCHELHDTSVTLETTSTNSRTGVTAKNRSYIRSNMQTAYMTALKGPNSAGTNTVFQNKPSDYAFASASPDASDPNFPYNGVCQACHSATSHHTQAQQTAGDDHMVGLNCGICHQHTYTNIGKNKAFIPYHPDTHFGWDAECQRCHSNIEIDAGSATEGVVSFVHKFNCGDCHTDGNNPSLANANRNGANGNAALAAGSAAAGFSAAYTCKTCHPDNTEFHGYSVAAVGSRHNISSNSSRGYDCQACHGHKWTTGDQVITRHMAAGTDSAARCASACHNGTAANISARSGVNNNTLIKNASINTDPNPNAFTCESCHVAKGDFTMHGLTDDDSIADGIDNPSGPNGITGLVTHNNLGGSVGAWSTSGNTMPSYRAASYNGKIDYDTYGGLLASDYNCGDCHSGSISTKSFTTLRAMQVHTKANGVGRGDCLTCHVNALSVADEINAGKGAAGTTVNCETCHSIANGNGPSGEKLYQYDGLRHHKTARAQAGDCTWCHADPRPATPVQGTWDGYNAYADTADSDGSGGADDATDGWAADYTAPTAAYTTPKQPGCYLCHTNATSYSVEVYGLNGLHGYNFNAGTPAQRTTGLTVWANNYDARAGTYPNRSNAGYDADPVTQALVHRIEANDGTSLIKAENLGACMACHSVQLHHAVPKPTADYDNYNGNRYRMPWDVLRYGPGRSIFGNGYLFRGVSNSATAWDDHMMNAGWRRECRWSDCEDRTRRGYMREQPAEFSWGAGVSGNSQVVVPCNSNYNNFENLTNLCASTGVSNGGQYQAIVFADFAAATVDSIYITLAEWNGTDVNVRIYNRLGAGQTMRLSYSGGACTNAPVNLTWNTDHYEGTCANPGNFTNGIDSVTVSNQTTASTLDVRTRLVKDGSAP